MTILQITGNSVPKAPTDQAQCNMSSFIYNGPAVTLYAVAGVLQMKPGGLTLVWASNPVSISVPNSPNDVSLNGPTLPMSPGSGATAPDPGPVDGIVVIGTNPDALINLNSRLFELIVTNAYQVSGVSGGVPTVSGITATFS